MNFGMVRLLISATLKILGVNVLLRDDVTRKFDAKFDEGIFLGYSTKSKEFKCYKKRTNKIVESVNVKVDELSKKSDETSRSKPKNNEENLVFIEPEVQKNDEQNNAEIGAQLVNEESNEKMMNMK